MPGELLAIDGSILEGWAATGRANFYRPVVCVFVGRSLVKAFIPAGNNGTRYLAPHEMFFGFRIDLAEIIKMEQVIGNVQHHLTLVIGETNEVLMWKSLTPTGIIQVEDLFNIRSGRAFRPVVSPYSELNFADALVAGMSIQDVLLGFYMDILMREPSEEELAIYSAQLVAKSMSFDEIRQQMLGSPEFKSFRMQRSAELPGSFFCRPYIWDICGIQPRTAEADELDQFLSNSPKQDNEVISQTNVPGNTVVVLPGSSEEKRVKRSLARARP